MDWTRSGETWCPSLGAQHVRHTAESHAECVDRFMDRFAAGGSADADSSAQHANGGDAQESAGGAQQKRLKRHDFAGRASGFGRPLNVLF